MALTTAASRVFAGLFSLLLVACNQGKANTAEVLVYKSPTCGCCTKWESHLRGSGFSVTSEKRTDMDTVKDTEHVPEGVRACHTALVDGYVI